MKAALKIEELFMFLLGVILFGQLDFNWWWFLVLLLAPDIGMLGYLFNPKTGAITYNLLHHKGLAIGLYVIGIYLQNQGLQLAGIMLFAHASLDRIFGYGLKYFSDFKHTHLGNLGNSF
ncbi:DUF4260 domain-containing protein [Aestuariivivens sediminicola]|uniref:DUF4260 domain-containing protein n=1 Tax=Aestuariivivens sediminicola TaxID=2913560 RepID=UPI001F56939E|nr:DUF4260 domain-containing protein [Aestuariivivens sediminicola]